MFKLFNGGFIALCLIFLLPYSKQEETKGFINISQDVGLNQSTWSGPKQKTHIRESLGQGICWIDYDNDGDMDLFIPNGSQNPATKANQFLPWLFYINYKGKFKPKENYSDINIQDWGIACAIADIDGDGFDDLLVTTASGKNVLLHNTGSGQFENWSNKLSMDRYYLSAGAAFADFDQDGDLDLVIARYLDESYIPKEHCLWQGVEVMCGPKGFPKIKDLIYRNNGKGDFELMPLGQSPGFGLGLILFDSDNDNDIDIFIANDSSPNHFYINQGNFQFEEMGLVAGVALSETGMTQAGMGVDAGDLDNDGLQDLVVTNFSSDSNNFYHNDGYNYFSEWAGKSGIKTSSYPMLGWSTLLEDFDLDGDLDIFVVNGHVYPEIENSHLASNYQQKMQLLFNQGNGKFYEDEKHLGAVFQQPIAGRGAALTDYDQDGDMDIIVIRDGAPPLLLKNNLAQKSHHWLQVRLKGPSGNPHAIGAKVLLHSNSKTQIREIRANRGYLSASEPIAAFGLGKNPKINSLDIIWPNGLKTKINNVKINQRLTLIAPSNI